MNWTKVAWKGIRSALAGVVVLGLIAAAEAMLGAVDTPEELTQLGAPAMLVPILLGLGSAARNWLKHRKPVK